MGGIGNVFAYGTLQLPEVMQAVTRAVFPAQPATLPGYARYALRGLAYPGLRAQAGTATDGILYGGIDAAALRRLDDFEDGFYRRENLRVRLASGAWTRAEVYVVPPEHYGLLLPAAWDMEAFQATALDGFMARCHAGA
ncbi:gamma-glutamylcyclotransferase family protein [Methylomagnum ishizawai]|uniref:gamma-glutamylcyclotransferase family protein n=1 Tax=Methylomagnum ishizawai TaxID=1760988 RepID=UPI001C33DEE7|nr:gamma-glutamylcyclotransferase family protein [Methylomagnum ishizawai]BBL73456.1 hypothetical protein MishRS11D_05540 [Methylomagnum ishizawai]